VFLTVHSDSDFVRRCLSTGAFGYVFKTRIASELIPAIRGALVGRIFVSQHDAPGGAGNPGNLVPAAGK
jgi:DNA-binding NarL/FixJ family response regulator